MKNIETLNIQYSTFNIQYSTFKKMKIVIIDYGGGNIQSVKFAFQRLGIEPILSNNAEIIKSADKIVFPGVGEASTAMKAIKSNNLDDLIPELKQPFLGICLGMQLLCSSTEENNTNCLNIFPIKVKKFEPILKVPHMGWNNINISGKGLFENIESKEYVYFIHSYYVPANKYSIANTNYIENFSAAINKNNFYACQFHPEKSGKTGEKILKNFLKI